MSTVTTPRDKFLAGVAGALTVYTRLVLGETQGLAAQVTDLTRDNRALTADLQVANATVEELKDDALVLRCNELQGEVLLLERSVQAADLQTEHERACTLAWMQTAMERAQTIQDLRLQLARAITANDLEEDWEPY